MGYSYRWEDKLEQLRKVKQQRPTNDKKIVQHRAGRPEAGNYKQEGRAVLGRT